MYERYFDEAVRQMPGGTNWVEGAIVPWVDGRTLLRHLNERRSRWTRWKAEQFYRMMAEMEDAGLVEGRWFEITLEGQPVHVRRFRLTAAVKGRAEG